MASPGSPEQVVPPEQLGVPPLAVEQKEKQIPAPLILRHVLPFAQSLALAHELPDGAVPRGAQIAPFCS
jgi:hypothetical protein